MPSMLAGNFRSAEVEVPCRDLPRALSLLEELQFVVEMIMPADDPQIAVVAGHGLRLRLVAGDGPSGVIRIACDQVPARWQLEAGGIRVELVDAHAPVALPPNRPALVIVHEGAWGLGRAGMEYRDLIPDRYGGRFIASHIRIPQGGPVPDYVHWHAIRFQLIYCYRGWVRLVYEDQGEPFVMNAGDCVIQPPRIRHRVLESSDGLEVIEVSCPAIHETHADPVLALPSGTRDRVFEGQRFTLHRASDPYAARDLGIAAASGGVAGARVVDGSRAESAHDAELLFGFVLRGEVVVNATPLVATDSFAIPPGMPYTLAGSADLAWLEVTLPAR